MALLSKKEFAEKCGISTRELSVYIKRGKVETNSDGQIDDTNLKNVDFASRHADKNLHAEPTPPKKSSKQPKKEKEVGNKPDDGSKLLYELEKEKKLHDIQAVRHRNELMAMDLAKKAGKLIPTDDVKSLFAQHSKSITMSFKQFIEGFLSEIAQKTKMNANQVAEFRSRMIAGLNKSVDDAVNSTRESLELIKSKLENDKEKV